MATTKGINLDPDNISERLKVHATRLKEVEPHKTVKRGEPIMQKKKISNMTEIVAKQRKRGMTQDGERPRQSNCHLLMDSMDVLINFLLRVDHIITSHMINHRPRMFFMPI